MNLNMHDGRWSLLMLTNRLVALTYLLFISAMLSQFPSSVHFRAGSRFSHLHKAVFIFRSFISLFLGGLRLSLLTPSYPSPSAH